MGTKEDKKNVQQPVAQSQNKNELKTVGDAYIHKIGEEAEKVMAGMGLVLEPEVKQSLFNLGLSCSKAIKDKGITWESVDKDGLVSKLLHYAQLGLNPASNELYLYVSQDKEKWVITFEESYLGKVKKVKKFSIDGLIEPRAYIVREGDSYEPDINVESGDNIEFKPLPFNTGKIIGAFCYLIYKDKARNRLIEMPIEELEQVKEASKNKMGGKLSPAWSKWESEMYKKATLKRAVKDVQIDVPAKYQSAFLNTEEYDDANYDLKTVKDIPESKTVIIDAKVEEPQKEETQMPVYTTEPNKEEKVNDTGISKFE